jgi:hypothetical protein
MVMFSKPFAAARFMMECPNGLSINSGTTLMMWMFMLAKYLGN